MIWATEGLRLWLVIQALALPGVSMGVSGAFFVAFIGSLLTAVPLSPAGLGIVELGVVGVLVGAYGLPITEATTIALVDRFISVFSIIIVGSILYVVSPLRRGEGLSQPIEASTAASLTPDPREGPGTGSPERVTPGPHETPPEPTPACAFGHRRRVPTGDWAGRPRIRHCSRSRAQGAGT